MDEHAHQAHEQTEDIVEIEISDLDPPGRSRRGRALSSDLLFNRRLSRQQRLSRLATTSGIVLVGLIAMLVSLYGGIPFHMPASSSTHPLAILPQRDGLTCLVDAAWSPDSQRVAFLGYQQECTLGGALYYPGLVTVYDASSGKMIKRLQPDAAILRLLHASAHRPPGPAGVILEAIQTPTIYYQHLLWSPDGRRLALTFSAAAAALHAATFDGVLLIDLADGQTQVMMQPDHGSFAIEWDLEQGTGRPVASALGAGSLPLLVQPPPALAYRWDTSGDLLPQTPLAGASAASSGPVGNPAGGGSFTIWQPGVAQTLLGPSDARNLAETSDMYTWSTTFAVWSPDGRYLLNAFGFQAQLAASGQRGPSARSLADPTTSQMPLLPARDAGLRQVLTRLRPEIFEGAVVSWRPDGRVLAAYQPVPDPGRAALTVDLYDCATGHQMIVLVPADSSQLLLMSNATLLLWSPDGTRLLFSSPLDGAVTLWGPSQLAP